MAKLDTSGNFVLRGVVQGNHVVNLEQSGRVVDSVPTVVEKKRISDWGIYEVCPDLDGDTFDQSVDCDDMDAFINPLVEEICDGIDNNCDDQVDGGDCVSCFDADRDLYYSAQACGTALDCDDGDAAIHPYALELCDGIDNDCDGISDNDPSFDADGDGYTWCGGDCDDSDDMLNPGVEEICDSLDNDCDGVADNGFDKDNDGWTVCEGDCGDNEWKAYPGSYQYVTSPFWNETLGAESFDANCDGQEEKNLRRNVEFTYLEAQTCAEMSCAYNWSVGYPCNPNTKLGNYPNGCCRAAFGGFLDDPACGQEGTAVAWWGLKPWDHWQVDSQGSCLEPTTTERQACR